jgi:hypothetical protein
MLAQHVKVNTPYFIVRFVWSEQVVTNESINQGDQHAKFIRISWHRREILDVRWTSQEERVRFVRSVESWAVLGNIQAVVFQLRRGSCCTREKFLFILNTYTTYFVYYGFSDQVIVFQIIIYNEGLLWWPLAGTAVHSWNDFAVVPERARSGGSEDPGRGCWYWSRWKIRETISIVFRPALKYILNSFIKAIRSQLKDNAFNEIHALDPSSDMLAVLRRGGSYKKIYQVSRYTIIHINDSHIRNETFTCPCKRWIYIQDTIGHHQTAIPERCYDVTTSTGGFVEGHMPLTALDEMLRITKKGTVYILCKSYLRIINRIYRNKKKS